MSKNYQKNSKISPLNSKSYHKNSKSYYKILNNTINYKTEQKKIEKAITFPRNSTVGQYSSPKYKLTSSFGQEIWPEK